jgi:hypothetical protein
VDVNFGNECTPMYVAHRDKFDADVHTCTFCCSCEWRFYQLPTMQPGVSTIPKDSNLWA